MNLFKEVVQEEGQNIDAQVIKDTPKTAAELKKQ